MARKEKDLMNEPGALPPANGADAPFLWLVGRRSVVLAVLLLLAAALRVVYVVQVVGSPAADQHRWDQSDMAFFDQWAGQIAAGDLLSVDVGHPFHRWHARIADAYLEDRPVLRLWLGALSADGGSTDAAQRELWSGWYGKRRFHQAPLYPYLLAATRWIGGASPLWVWLWQAVLGCATVAMSVIIAWRLYGPVAGLAAGVMAVASGALVFADCLLLRASISCFGALALAWIAMSALRKDGWLRWLAVGVLTGLLVLLKPSFLVAWAGLTVGLVLVALVHPVKTLKGLAALTIGAIAVLAPAVVRNTAAGTDPLSLSSVGAITFVSSNAADVPPAQGYFTRSRFAPTIMGATDGQLVPAIRATVATHSDLPAYNRFLLLKAVRVWHWYEAPNNANYYLYRKQAPILRLLPVGFFVVGPLGLVGLALGLSSFRKAWPLYVVVVSVFVPLVVFYSLARFRLPLMAALLPFAALTLDRLAAWIRARRVALAVMTGVVLVALAFWVGRPLPPGQQLIRLADYGVAAEVGVLPRAREAAQIGDWQKAADIVGAFIDLEPPLLSMLGPDRPAGTAEEAAVAHLFGDLRLRQAALLAEAGDLDRALSVRQAGLQLHAVAAPTEAPSE